MGDFGPATTIVRVWRVGIIRMTGSLAIRPFIRETESVDFQTYDNALAAANALQGIAEVSIRPVEVER